VCVYMLGRVCVCVRGYMRLCVLIWMCVHCECVSVCVCVYVCVCVSLCVCVLASVCV